MCFGQIGQILIKLNTYFADLVALLRSKPCTVITEFNQNRCNRLRFAVMVKTINPRPTKGVTETPLRFFPGSTKTQIDYAKGF